MGYSAGSLRGSPCWLAGSRRWSGSPIRACGGCRGLYRSRSAADERRDFRSIYDVSGDGALLDELIGRLAPGGEIVLAGFYSEPLSFAFAPAFMREIRLRVAAEWQRDDMEAVRALTESGHSPWTS